SVVAFRKLRYETMGSGHLRSPTDLLHRHIWRTVRDIALNGFRKQEYVLHRYCYAFPEGFEVIVLYIFTVYQHSTPAAVIKPGNQANECRFPGTRRSHHCHCLPGICAEIYILEHRLLAITEVYIPEFHPSFRLSGDGTLTALYFRLSAE